MPEQLTEGDHRRIDEATRRFIASRRSFEIVAESLVDCFKRDAKLGEFVYFIRHRVKNADSLRAKLRRIALSSEFGSEADPVSASNLFERIGDLAGLWIIHLHTEQLNRMHPLVLGVLKREKYEIANAPTAYCWDVEYQEFFEQVGIRTEQRPTMYTTVHYDIVANKEPGIRCELQVRSLMDEAWAEVSHRVNYPAASPSAVCRDQLKVLARLTSGCGRLVDSIFKTHYEAVQREPEDGQSRTATRRSEERP